MKLKTKSNIYTAIIFAVSICFLYFASIYEWLLPITAILFIGGLWFKVLSNIIYKYLKGKE